MEKCRLKIKLTASATRRPTNSTPDRGSAGPLLEEIVTADLQSSSEANILLGNGRDMKRKRGSKAGDKKGKRKEQSVIDDPASAPVFVNTEDNLSLDETDDGQQNHEMDMHPPSLEPDKVSNVSNIDADIPIESSTGKPGHGRVRVKLRSSGILEPYRTFSDAQTASDTDKSNPQVSMDMPDTAVEKKDDSTYSDGQISEMQNTVSGKSPRKAGSIKIKSSRGLGSSSIVMQDKHLNKQTSPPEMMGERGLVPSDNEKTADSSMPRKLRQKEAKAPYWDPRYNEEELNAALEVIKKVMKMDAAEPFNSPVNPVALGIPDYFDIIQTPMDFGTICHDLECGHKYMNSKDVFKDVHFIWDNCYKYNNKGDYIVNLMKRVKKNFMKYWMSAGLYFDTASGATESTHVEDDIHSSHEKMYTKGKSKHKRRRHGIDRHKNDCLCAVCVVRRRRKEREENVVVVERQMAISDASLPQEFKQEDSSPVDNPCSEDVLSSLDNSLDADVNADIGETEHEENTFPSEQPGDARPEKEMTKNEMELHNACTTNESSQKLPLENGTLEEFDQQAQEQDMEFGFLTQPGDQKDDIVVQKEAVAQHHQEAEKQLREAAERTQQIQVHNSPSLEENHSILQICRTLFPSDPRSVWNGPHSLNRRHVSARDGPIHAAMATFMFQ